ncbi:zinc finger protein 271-like isoform X3 [Sardina pilchardus]|uniref:zinc finger protein 271-like isoform X3 n=1 Tax=Sardina pilchardus TaxID=27697 RepID=UPI002E11335A
MAAVYEKGGTLQGNIVVLSKENEEGTCNAGVSSNPNQIKAEDLGAFVDSRLSGPATSENHAEMDGMNAMPSIIIKEERIEDEEYMQINLSDVGEESETAADNGSESTQEENVDVKLRSMRCQDCGQQFTRWEAFKIHLRKHVEEEAELANTAKKRPLQPQNQNGGKRRRDEYKIGDKDEDEEVDVVGFADQGEEEEEDFFDSTCQIKPSEIVKVRPRVAMLSAEEKPVYGNNNQVYVCDLCEKVYYYLESFRNHQKSHTASEVESSHPCLVCGKLFKGAIKLSAHMRVHRKTVVANKPPEHHCDQCDESFHSAQTWLEHTEMHKKEQSWCLSCSEGFKDAKSLDMHLLHHDPKRHRCNLCFKSFKSPAELRYHYSNHKAFKPYKCSFCDKDFPQLANLIKHHKTHLGVYKEGTTEQLDQGKSTNHGNKKLSVVEKLKKLIGSKGVAQTPDKFLWQAHHEAEAMLGSGSGDNEEIDSYNGNKEGYANADSSEEEEQEEAMERTGNDVVQREDGHCVEEEDDDDVVFTGQVSAPVQPVGEWRCFECGTSFFQEAELHLHYMRHASGEL